MQVIKFYKLKSGQILLASWVRTNLNFISHIFLRSGVNWAAILADMVSSSCLSLEVNYSPCPFIFILPSVKSFVLKHNLRSGQRQKPQIN